MLYNIGKKKEIKMKKDTDSYMQFCLYLEGRGNLYLRAPTYWDAVNKQWIGFIKSPKTLKIIKATGKNSFELQNNFNISLGEFMQNNPDEGLSMFKALEYWENKEG